MVIETDLKPTLEHLRDVFTTSLDNSPVGVLAYVLKRDRHSGEDLYHLCRVTSITDLRTSCNIKIIRTGQRIKHVPCDAVRAIFQQ